MIDETVREIEEMQTQSASVVAVKAAEALRELTERDHYTAEEFVRALERNSSALRQANHSHTPLHTTQRRIVETVTDADPESVEAGEAALLAVIDDVVEEVEESKRHAAAEAAALVEDGDVLLTHENSSTVMATIERALDDGKELGLYVTEARPRFLGRRTARRLADRDGVDVTVVVDGAAGHVLAECDRVLVGMNCLIDDVVYNRVGTYPIAATANDRGVPVTVVASSMKFVGNGFEFENTFRSPSEVLLEPPEGFEAANPSYDATPTRLVDGVATEDGVIEF